MTSRERVMAAVNHQEPDRVPIDLGSTRASAINVSAYFKLLNRLGLKADKVRIYDPFSMNALLDPEIVEVLGIDVVLVPSLYGHFDIPINEWKPWRLPDGTPVQVPAEFQTSEGEDGALLLMVDGKAVGKMPREGFYFSVIADSTMGWFDSLVQAPDVRDVVFSKLTNQDLSFRREFARIMYETTDKALVVDLLDNMRWDTSQANWMYALAAEPERVNELHQKKALNLVEKIKQLFEAVGPYVQVFAIYQDFGTQGGEAISPTTFERLIMPHFRHIFDWIHKNTDWKVLFHSCGSIYYLIPLMIEMGVDILNPVQTNAANMEPQLLKERFGDRLVFWGGGIETQTVLPFGTQDEVRRQVKERVLTLGPGGGFVFAPCQDIQAEVPSGNVLAAYQAARDFGRYPL
jgi:uroporphyrinogen decarboxylase